MEKRTFGTLIDEVALHIAEYEKENEKELSTCSH